MLFDAHAHLDDEKFGGELDGVVEKLLEAGVVGVVNAACDEDSCHTSLALAEKYPWCYFTVGIHPHCAKDYTPETEALIRRLAAHPKCVAVGEIGLDYHYDNSPREAQRAVFARQLVLADELGKPVVLHLREAYEDANQILAQHRDKLRNGVLLHCYSGSAELARDVYNGLDAYYSFGGAITFAKHKDKVLAVIPPERLLLETDCPYMTPVPLRGQRNDPSLLPYVCAKMAELIGKTPEEVALLTTQNARRFYRLEDK